MDKRISLDELKTYLWKSAEYLRSSIDAGNYKQYIFPLLFFKRINDVYDEETKNALKENEDISDYSEDEIHKFIIPNGCHWDDIRNVNEDVGVALVKAFKEIEKANGKRLEGIFGDGNWTNKNRLPDSLLKDLFEHFSSKILSIENCPEDELGQGYEYLIKKFADDSGHTAQEFYTNRTVVHLMTELLEPKSGESVYDPTCGSAGMLISTIAHLKNKKQEYRNLKIYGQEINNLTSAIGRMNLFLHGIEDFEIINDDTLKHPAFKEGNRLKTFNVVLANPPYSISEWDRSSFEHDLYGRNFLGLPPQDRADYAFIQHILKSLDSKNGRCAILLPHGVLFRGEEKDIRKKLIETDLVECIIGIGKNLFFNSSMDACIIICNTHKKEERVNKILFIDAKNEVTRKDNFSYLEDKHIDKIVDAFRNYKSIDSFCSVVNKEDILNNDSKLSISLYVRKGKVDSYTREDIVDYSKEWIDSITNSDIAIGRLADIIDKE